MTRNLSGAWTLCCTWLAPASASCAGRIACAASPTSGAALLALPSALLVDVRVELQLSDRHCVGSHTRRRAARRTSSCHSVGTHSVHSRQ